MPWSRLWKPCSAPFTDPSVGFHRLQVRDPFGPTDLDIHLLDTGH